MSATLTTAETDRTSAAPPSSSGYSPGRAVLDSTRAELLRLRKWPAVWVTIGAWLSMNAMFGYLFDYLTYSTGNNSFSNEGQSPAELLSTLLPADLADKLPQGMPMFGGAIMMVLGAIVAGNGYGWGTWKTVLTQGPSRSGTLAGSLAALTSIVAGVVAATLATSYAMSLAVAFAESQSTALPGFGELAKTVGASLMVMEMWALAGFLLGTLARSAAVSVGLGLVWTMVVENLLRGVGASLDWVDAFTHLLPGTASGSLIGQLVGTGPTASPGLLDSVSLTQGLWTTVAYVVAFPLAAWVLVRRRDVA